jgi:hypothetical protein
MDKKIKLIFYPSGFGQIKIKILGFLFLHHWQQFAVTAANTQGTCKYKNVTVVYFVQREIGRF